MKSREGSEIQRSAAVGVAMMCDIIVNYPLWIAAKRIGAHLSPFPDNFRMIYQGGGTLWFSLGPTTMVEDFVSRTLSHLFDNSYKGVSAATSGVVAALLVTSQVEHIITASHVRQMTIFQTISSTKPRNLFLPPGMIAMVGREVPFSTALFYFRPLIEKNERDCTSSLVWYKRLAYDIKYGVMTSMIATPLSHPASVIASYQQGHNQSFLGTVKLILNKNGWKGFFRGLIARTISLSGTFTIVPIVLRVLSPASLDLE